MLESDYSVRKELDRSLTTEYRNWMTTSEAADYLRVSASRLLNLASNGEIPFYKLGRSNRYLKTELDELLLSQPKGERHGN